MTAYAATEPSTAARMQMRLGRASALTPVQTRTMPAQPQSTEPVSYTHLDVYKRQVLGGEGTVSDTQQTPEKTEVFTPTADPTAGTSVEESPDSVIVEEPAESVPAEQPADEQPAEPTPEVPAESEASTEAPAESEASSESTGGAETPSISLPTQEQVESAANSLHQAASTVLDLSLIHICRRAVGQTGFLPVPGGTRPCLPFHRWPKGWR